MDYECFDIKLMAKNRVSHVQHYQIKNILLNTNSKSESIDKIYNRMLLIAFYFTIVLRCSSPFNSRIFSRLFRK